MKLRKVRVKGFQAFADSGEIEFGDGINLIIGANNVGKSALLRALRPEFADDRHRSAAEWIQARLPLPCEERTIEFSGGEFEEAIINFASRQPTSVLLPRSYIESGKNVGEYIRDIIKNHKISSKMQRTPFGVALYNICTANLSKKYNEDFSDYGLILTLRDGKIDTEQLQIQKTNTRSDGEIIKIIMNSKMFYFSSERVINYQQYATNQTKLQSNASNLASVLFALIGESGSLIDDLINHLREIFPTVGNISVGPVARSGDPAQIGIFVWPTQAMKKPELRFPLQECGTGVAQVIAILTAVMTCENAVLIIDEINTFLHPAAVKALLRILQSEYGHHQYIIASHSPEVIASGAAQSIHLVRREGYESWVEKLDIGKIAHLREAAGQLGISMMDVFAAERIVWVEGETEELCSPRLYEMATGRSLPQGVRFIAVLSTGDFQRKRDKELVFEIYERLWRAALPLARSAVISFDSEGLTKDEKSDMEGRSKDAIRFLPRRNLECYLLDPEAIAEFISERLSDGTQITPEQVETELGKLAASQNYKNNIWSGNLGDPDWIKKVDGAKLLSETCGNISENHVTYNKKADAYALISKIGEKNQNHLDELLKYVKGLVEAVSASPGKA